MQPYIIDQLHPDEFGINRKLDRDAFEPRLLAHVLSKLLGTAIVRADYETTQLYGGTLGDVRLVSGKAVTSDENELPYKVVVKTQKRWERPGDPNSWRREYDLYTSDLAKSFTGQLRWPECYHAELNGDVIQIWMEYIDGVSGGGLTIETLEQAARELGRFQGRLSKQSESMPGITCLGDTGYMRRDFAQWTPETVEYRYLHSDECGLPEHLRQMLKDTQRRAEAIFSNTGRLPIVLCHRDFWIENIFLSDESIILIDWDTAGWGYLGEDIASLIADETDAQRLPEYYRRLVPAYLSGISEYMDISEIDDFFIREMIIIKFGYRLLQQYMFSQSPDEKNQVVIALQNISEMV